MRSACLSSLVVVGCGLTHPASDAPAEADSDEGAARLATLMTGHFSSAAQAAADTANYFDIRLHVARVWTARADGPWLYVEQAAAETPGEPYRQRVYRLSRRADGAYESAVYTLPDPPLHFPGA